MPRFPWARAHCSARTAGSTQAASPLGEDGGLGHGSLMASGIVSGHIALNGAFVARTGDVIRFKFGAQPRIHSRKRCRHRPNHLERSCASSVPRPTESRPGNRHVHFHPCRWRRRPGASGHRPGKAQGHRGVVVGVVIAGIMPSAPEFILLTIASDGVIQVACLMEAGMSMPQRW